MQVPEQLRIKQILLAIILGLLHPAPFWHLCPKRMQGLKVDQLPTLMFTLQKFAK